MRIYTSALETITSKNYAKQPSYRTASEECHLTLVYSHDVQTQTVRIQGSGEVSIEDRMSFLAMVFQDVSLPATSSVLIDVNAVTTTPTDDEIKIIAMLVRRIMTRFSGRVAILNVKVGHVTISNLIAAESAAGTDRVRVCTSEKSATAWIAKN